MKKLKVKLNYKFKTETKEKPQEITYNFITLAVSKKYPNGLNGSYRRIFARLQEKLDRSLEKDETYIEIEESEYDLLKNIKDAEIPAVYASNFTLLEDAIEESGKNEPKIKEKNN